jgi:hypothetical protein
MKKQNYLKGFSIKPNISGKLNYTDHATDEAEKDGVKWFDLPSHLASNAFLVELDFKHKNEFKAVYRQPHNNEQDLTLVVKREGNRLVVITTWLCAKDFNPRKESSTWTVLAR